MNSARGALRIFSGNPPARLTKSYAETSTILVEKFNSSSFNRFLYFDFSVFRNARAKAAFETLDSRQRQPRARSKFRLGPTEKAACGT